MKMKEFCYTVQILSATVTVYCQHVCTLRELWKWNNLTLLHVEGRAQDYGNSNIFLKPLFRGNLDPFVNNANLGAIAHMSNGT